jgi:hypothetical protein
VRGHAAGAGIARLSTQQKSAGGGSGQLQTRGIAMDMAVGMGCGCRGMLLACCAVAVFQASGRETLATSFPKLAHADDLIGRSGDDNTTTNTILARLRDISGNICSSTYMWHAEGRPVCPIAFRRVPRSRSRRVRGLKTAAHTCHAPRECC